MKDEQGNQRGLMQTLRDAALKGASAVTGRPIARRCPSCNEWILQDDKHTACGEHQPIPEGANPIRMTFVPSPEPALPEPPKVERLGRSSDERQVSNRFKDPTKSDPVRQQPEEDDPTDEWASVRNTGGYKRKEAPDTSWGMSSKELARAQDQAEFGLDDDEEPPTPTNPRYSL